MVDVYATFDEIITSQIIPCYKFLYLSRSGLRKPVETSRNQSEPVETSRNQSKPVGSSQNQSVGNNITATVLYLHRFAPLCTVCPSPHRLNCFGLVLTGSDGFRLVSTGLRRPDLDKYRNL